MIWGGGYQDSLAAAPVFCGNCYSNPQQQLQDVWRLLQKDSPRPPRQSEPLGTDPWDD